MHVIFDEYDEHSQPKENVEKQDDQNVEVLQSPHRSWWMVGDHPLDQIIGSTTDGVRTRMFFQNNNMIMISQIEPKSINESIIDDSGISKIWKLLRNSKCLMHTNFSRVLTLF